MAETTALVATVPAPLSLEHQVVNLLFVGVATVPLAVYFLWLGALNCRSSPVVTNGLRDLVALMAGFGGLLTVGPAFALVIARQDGHISAASLVVIVMLAAAWFVMASAKEQRSHVIYNIGKVPFWNGLENALEDLSIAYRRYGNMVTAQDVDLQLTVQTFAALRNVTIYHRGEHAAEGVPRIIDRLKERLATVKSGASVAGGCFLAIGSAVLMIPIYLALEDNVLLAYLFGA